MAMAGTIHPTIAALASSRAFPKQQETAEDPLRQVTDSFPNSIKLDEKRRVLEFCPDNTCHGFVASNQVSIQTLKDFGYLYLYFFSDYVELPEWRKKPEAINTAQFVLSKPAYLRCRNQSSFQAARCVLLKLSRNGSIRQIFIRYDEGKRNVVKEDVVRELLNKKAPSAQ